MDKIYSLVKENKFFIGVIIFLSSFKLYQLGSGLVMGEPDEWNHLEVARNFSESIYPNYSGVPFYYSLPLYPFLGFLLSFIVPEKFLALRLLSFIFSLIISLAIYFYIKKKLDKWAGLFAAIVFVLTPLSIYYSRLGMIEMALTCFAFLSVIFFDEFIRTRKNKFAAASGLFLGLGLLTKYTTSFVIFSTLVYSFIDFTKFFIQKKFDVLKKFKETFKKYFGIILHYSLALVVFLPVVGALALNGKHDFRVQWDYIFSLKGGSGFFFGDYLINSSWYFSPITVGLFLLGIVWLLVRNSWKNYLLVLLTLVIGFYFIGKFFVTPRYLVFLLPYISIVAGLGVYFIFGLLKEKLKIAVPGVLIAIFLPFIPQPINASNHSIVEEVGNYVKEINKENKWVLTNYWPSVFIDETGSYKTTWLSASVGDSQAFSTHPKSRYQDIAKPSYEALLDEGAVVILEDLYSTTLTSNSRQMPIDVVKHRYRAIKVFEDNNSNWPFFKESKNKISVYLVTK